MKKLLAITLVLSVLGLSFSYIHTDKDGNASRATPIGEEYLAATKTAGSAQYSQLVVSMSNTRAPSPQPVAFVDFKHRMDGISVSEGKDGTMVEYAWKMNISMDLWGNNLNKTAEMAKLSSAGKLTVSQSYTQMLTWPSSPTAGCWGTHVWCKDFDKPSYLGRAQPFSEVEVYGMKMSDAMGSAIAEAIAAKSMNERSEIFKKYNLEVNDLNTFSRYINVLKKVGVSPEEISGPIKKGLLSVKMQLEAVNAVKHAVE